MTFKEYLAHIGIDSSQKTTEELALLRVEYRRFYNRQYSKTYRKKFKRYDIPFSHKENSIILKVAQTYGVKPSTLIHHTTLAYLESKVYLPAFEDVIQTKQLMRISANAINQLVTVSHIEKSVPDYRFLELVERIMQKERCIDSLYLAPKIVFTPLNFNTNVD